MGARYGAWAVVRPHGRQVEVELSVVDLRGEPRLHAVVAGDTTDQLALGDQVGTRILAAIADGLPASYRRGAALVRVRPEAAVEFLQGEAAAERGAWLVAERHYDAALRLDSTFVLAAWRLGNARRWMPLRATPPFPTGFYRLFQSRAGDLTEVDRRLVEAQFAPSGVPRFVRYDSAMAVAPADGYVKLLYGDELFHRGPLSGRGLDEAVRMLQDATTADPTLAPAWEHLAWACIRLGHREEAERALDQLRRLSGRREEREIDLPALLGLAFVARFQPEALAGAGREALASRDNRALAARGALAFDLPDVQLGFGGTLSAAEATPAPLRASGHIAQGVALVALGRPAAALAELDAAGALFPDPRESLLQAAEWRLIPKALGVPGFSDAEAARGRRLLAERGERSGEARAAWALAVDAVMRSDTLAADRWRQALEQADSGAGPRVALVAALRAASAGDPARALRLSEPALAYDSAGYAPDPFFRAVLHLRRGDWQLALGQAEEADRSWRWYENTDVVGWPSAEAQSGEVDWALSPWVRVRRGALAASAGRPAEACVLARRSIELWARAEPAVLRLADSVRDATRTCAP
jgi:tetratricopeptide (TPR) repeat protein